MIFKEVFGKLYPSLDDSTLDRLMHCARSLQLSKGEILLEAGEMPESVPILEEGILRGCLVNGGRDVTDCFFYKYGSVMTGRSTLDKPSILRIEALTPCRVRLLPVEDVLELMRTDMVMVQAYNRVLSQALDRHWEEKLLLHCCTAMERYQWFLEAYPGLIDQVNNRYIASFLNMTPVTLSRLRRQIREEAAGGDQEADV